MAKYGVYIIESLRPKDHRDGKILHQILKLSDIPTLYKWANSVAHFKQLLGEFKKSNFRYIHISCHADSSGIEVDNTFISNEQLQGLTKGILTDKRFFLSACNGANKDLASRLIVKNSARSLIGMPTKLRFDKSILFWSSFYHLINEIDSKKMSRHDIIEIVKKCVDIFDTPVNYYSKINNSNTYLRRLKVRKDGVLDNRKIKTTI